MNSLPIVITLSLLAALLVSFTFTPLVSYYVLRGQKGFDEGGEVRSFFLFRWVDQSLAAVLPHYRAALENSLKRPWLVLGLGYSALALSCLLVPLLGSQFFPPAERNQLLVDSTGDVSMYLNVVCGEIGDAPRNLSRRRPKMNRMVVLCRRQHKRHSFKKKKK